MLNRIEPDAIGPRGQAMKDAVGACVHCGFCLPTCPTYLTMGEEMDSPRGRIFLMKEVLEGKLDPSEPEEYLDNCLGCLACVTSCPSGVGYGELITSYRAWSESRRKRSWDEKLLRRLLLATVPYPARMRLALTVQPLGKLVQGLLPKRIRPMLDLVPGRIPGPRPLASLNPAKGDRKGRVALLAGCAQQVLRPSINAAAVELLTRCGYEVIVPPDQGCCGALAMHIGADREAKESARRNLRTFPEDVDAIITTAAGCGSGIHEYPLLFKGEPEEEPAREYARKCIDITVFLERIGYHAGENGRDPPLKVAYHDACHLAHAQGVRDAPRKLLTGISGLTLFEPAEPEICCGSAGTYNIEHPGTAAVLGKRKADNLLATGPDVIATGNIGCIVQIEKQLADAGSSIPVMHTIELLAQQARARS